MPAISVDEGRRLLEPFHARLESVARKAMERWCNLPPQDRASLGIPRTQANTIWAYHREAALVEFQGDKRVQMYEKYNTLNMVFDGRVLLRFKKVNKRGRSSNVATQMSLAFYEQQQNLPGIPSIVRLELGYVLNILGIGYERLLVVLRDGRSVAWTYPLIGSDEGEQGARVLTIVPKSPVAGQTGKRSQRVADQER